MASERERENVEEKEVKVSGIYLARLFGEKMISEVVVTDISKSGKFVQVQVLGKVEKIWYERSKIEVYEER
jgi:hypothetical protein